MPLYEYGCLVCGRRTEVIQKFSEPPVKTCPACGGEVEKLLSSPAIHFKGSGWYITDYARKGPNGSGAKSSPETSAGEKPSTKATSQDSSSETRVSSETKPA
ncbi:MAG: FmdB family zinc ribbon protein [Acidobacteriota bacterium]